MTRKPSKSTVLRAVDFKKPRKISVEDFEALCGDLHIAASHRQALKARLDELVTWLVEQITESTLQPDRRSDRDRIMAALNNIVKARKSLKRLGPSGDLALRSIASSLAPMLSAQWISERFPNDAYAPEKTSPPNEGRMRTREPTRQPVHASKYFIEEHSMQARLYFVARRSAKAATTALETIEEGLDKAKTAIENQPGSRGGRRALAPRFWLIINLADAWTDFGGSISVGPKSVFVLFCEMIACSIGWPTEGLYSAIPGAVKHWRNLTGKINR